MADHDPAAAAKEAAARQAVELAGAVLMIAVAVVFQIAQREAMSPDFAQALGNHAKLWRRKLARRAEGRLARLGIWALAQAERQRRMADGN